MLLGFGPSLAIINCSPSSSSDPPPAGELDWVSVTRFLGEQGPLEALQTLSSRERSTRNRTPSQQLPLEVGNDATANKRSPCWTALVHIIQSWTDSDILMRSSVSSKHCWLHESESKYGYFWFFFKMKLIQDVTYTNNLLCLLVRL